MMYMYMYSNCTPSHQPLAEISAFSGTLSSHDCLVLKERCIHPDIHDTTIFVIGPTWVAMHCTVTYAQMNQKQLTSQLMH